MYYIIQYYCKNKITYTFAGEVNAGYEEVTDKGPYESPEVKRAINQMEKNGISPSTNYVLQRTPEQVRRIPMQPMQFQEPVLYQGPAPRTYVQQPRYYPSNEQPYYVVQPVHRDSFRYQ